MEKTAIGMRIVPMDAHTRKISHKFAGTYGSEPHTYKFEVVVGMPYKDMPYVTSPQIRNLVKDGKIKEGMLVGIMELQVNDSEKWIDFREYKPIGDAKDGDYERIGEAHDLLRGKGVASSIELACLKYLPKVYRSYAVYHSTVLSPERERQLLAI